MSSTWTVAVETSVERCACCRRPLEGGGTRCCDALGACEGAGTVSRRVLARVRLVHERAVTCCASEDATPEEREAEIEESWWVGARGQKTRPTLDDELTTEERDAIVSQAWEEED